MGFAKQRNKWRVVVVFAVLFVWFDFGHEGVGALVRQDSQPAAAPPPSGGASPTIADDDAGATGDNELFFELSNGLKFPAVSFGSAGLGQRTERAVRLALEAGFRGVDTAQATEWCVPTAAAVPTIGSHA